MKFSPGFSRRRAMQAIGLSSLAPMMAREMEAAQVPAPSPEGKDTPKIAISTGDTGLPGGGGGGRGAFGASGGRGGRGVSGAGRGANAATGGNANADPTAGPRRIKQLGVSNVLGGGPGGMPWTEESTRALMDRYKAEGLMYGNMMMNVSNNIIYGKPGRDDDIERIKATIQAAGKAGLPVIEYNFYAHRGTEGYFEEMDTARGNSGWTGFDYQRAVQGPDDWFRTAEDERGTKIKDLKPLPNEGAHTLVDRWANISYYLKAVVPVAEKANVRMALHRTIRRRLSAEAHNRSWARSMAGRNSSRS